MATLTNTAGATITVPETTVADYLKQGWRRAGATVQPPRRRRGGGRKPRPTADQRDNTPES